MNSLPLYGGRFFIFKLKSTMLFEDGKKFNIPKEFLNSFTKPVTFQLTDNQGGFNVASGKIQFPASRGILPFYSYRKKVQGGGSTLVELRYAANQRKDGEGEYVYTPSTIDFIKGQFTCDPGNKNHIDIYYLLKNHPKCKDSAEAEGIPFFYEINPEKIAEDDVNRRIAKHDADELILKGWDEDQLKVIAFAFGDLHAEDKSKSQLQAFLSRLVDKDPVGFYKQAKSEELILRSNIVKGQSLKVIVEKEGVWYWGENKENDNKSSAEICRVRSGEDAITRLMIFFNRSVKAENLDYFLERLKAAQSVEA